ncbi:MAG: universal stress protein [Steroidobacteraceae bacterium]
MYQKILVPIDGSETAARGLAEAIKLASNQHSTIRLVHVVNELMVVASYEGTIYSGELITALRESGEKLLDVARHKVADAGVPVESELIEAHGGQAGKTIAADAERSQADLIVLGTHGRRGLSRVVMGSDAEQVVRTAKVPVLLVRTTK